jgi:C4-dicarboxylate-specific signal transduction histidine kinase
LLLGVGSLVLVLVAVLALLAQLALRSRAEQAIGNSLLQQVRLLAVAQGQVLAEGERSVARLHGQWLQRAGEADAPALARDFERWFAPGDDGVWRLRPQWLDLSRRPTFYLQPGKGLDIDTRFRAVLSLQLLSEQGPALVPPFFSAYVDFVEKGLMVYSPQFNWGAGATPQTDNFSYPTMQGSDPQRNPERRLFWTPVYFDAEAATWMVSVIQPLDWQGRWVGTVGHDIAIDRLLREVGSLRQSGVTAMVLSLSGELIAHPRLAERIAKAEGQLALDGLRDAELDQVLATVRAAPNEPQLARSADGSLLVASAPLPGPGWQMVLLLPQAVIEAELRQFTLGVLGVGLLCGLLALLLLRGLLRRLVERPLQRLHAGVQALAERRDPEALDLGGPRELAQLGAAFDRMAEALAHEESQQRAHAQQLELRVAERTQALQDANLQLEQSLAELQRAQQELVQQETLAGLGALVAGVSHELNTPLGNALIAADTVRAQLQILIEEIGSERPRRSVLQQQLASATQGIALACGNLQRSAELVAGFKRVAVDRAGLHRRRFDLRETTAEVLALLQLSFKRLPFVLRLEIPEGVVLDSYPGAYGQVMTNLVQNALLHAFEGRSQGEICIRLLERDADRLRLQISDDGVGIAAEHLPQLFKPFFTTKLGQGGSGLGLHIVYTLVGGALGGRIEVESKKGQGARFNMTLPLRAP